jgi:hypothetical protein
MTTSLRPDASSSDALVITVASGALLGLILMAQNPMDAQYTTPMHRSNDRSRFATIRALVDFNTYAIDGVIREKNWDTIDKMWRPDDKDPLHGHFYSSKPPLLPTLLAGEYKLLKILSGGQLTFADHPLALVRIIILTTNGIPMVLFLTLFARFLQRESADAWTRTFVLVTAGLGTYLTGFSGTLNNHTIAALSSFFALYPILCVEADGRLNGWRFALSGLFTAFTACNELPAAAFGLGMFLIILWRWPAPTAQFFVPAALVPLVGFFWTNYLVTGDLRPAYMHMSWYDYPGSYWNNPVSIDAIHEPWYVYLFHITLGHHGVFSLTPVLLLSWAGIFRTLFQRDGAAGGSVLPEAQQVVAAVPGSLEVITRETCNRQQMLRSLAGLAVVVTLVIFTFYTSITPLKPFGLAPSRNYGGMSNGFRYSFWLIPLWLIFLPRGLEALGQNRWLRVLALALLGVSLFSAFYATREPWMPSWIHQFLYDAGWIGY